MIKMEETCLKEMQIVYKYELNRETESLGYISQCPLHNIIWIYFISYDGNNIGLSP